MRGHVPVLALAALALVGAAFAAAGAGAAGAPETHIVNGTDLSLESGPGQAIRGRTSLDPGTELTVRVRSTDADSPFLRSATAAVGTDGGFRAVFDLSEVPPGTALRVVAHRGGSNLTATTARVVECSACPSPAPATPSAVLIGGGDQLALDNRPGQPIRGRTNLPPGTAVSVRVRSASSAQAFLRQGRAVVDSSGRFRAIFDFSQVTATADIQVGVHHNGTALTTARGTVECVECEPATTPDTEAAYAGAEIGVIQVENGSVARIRVRLGEADAAILGVRAPRQDYALNATLEDGDDDGTVAVLFNTSAAGENSRTASAAAPGDAVRVHAERGTFATTEYRLVLHPPETPSRTVATGLLVVVQGGANTPLGPAAPDSGTGLPLGSLAALAVGAALAVLGLGSLLGLVDLRGLFARR